MEGVRDHDKVKVQVIADHAPEPQPPWLAVKGILSEEAAEELSKLVNEMFPPWND